jgi:hypothetical protein
VWNWAVSTRKRTSTYIGGGDHSVSAMRCALGLLMPNQWMRLDVGRDETAHKNCDNKRRTFVRWRRNSAGRLWSRNDEAAQQRLQPTSAVKFGIKSTPECARSRLKRMALGVVSPVNGMIELLLELLLELVVEVGLELVFEVGAAIGWSAFEQSISDEDQSHKILGPLGLVLIGTIAGGISLLVYSRRLTPFRGFYGASLLVAPLGTGLIMEALGILWVSRGNVRMALFTFKGGFLFALGMALVRFAYLAMGWRMF